MPSEPRVISLIMAAGVSRRFGEVDKRLARMADCRTLLAASLAGARPCSAQMVLVIRPEDDPLALGVPEDVSVLRAARADQGLGASLADAFTWLAGEEVQADAAAVLLGDMPWIAADSYRRLYRQADTGQIVRPAYRGTAGHPVLFGQSFWPELGALDGDQGAREVLAGHPRAVVTLDLEDPGILQDVDRPEDLARPRPSV